MSGHHPVPGGQAQRQRHDGRRLLRDVGGHLPGHCRLRGRGGRPGGRRDTGAVYVFERTGSAWSEVVELNASEALGFDFGEALALEGDSLIVGAVRADSGTGPGTGAVYRFERTDGARDKVDKLAPDDAGELDHFGSRIALSEGSALVSSPVGQGATPSDIGAVYVFVDESQGVEVDLDDAILDPTGRAVQVMGSLVCPAWASSTLAALVEQGVTTAQGFVQSGHLCRKRAELRGAGPGAGPAPWPPGRRGSAPTSSSSRRGASSSRPAPARTDRSPRRDHTERSLGSAGTPRRACWPVSTER